MSWFNIRASTPPAILIAIGGIGYLSGTSGFGGFIALGFILQVIYLLR